MQDKVHNVVNVNIVVTDDELDHFPEVVSAMRQAGLSVEEEDGDLGLVSGSIAPERVPELRDVRGVGAGDEARSFQLAPPWSDTQ